jgi:hypothetical protein
MLVVLCEALAIRMGLYFHRRLCRNHGDHSVGPYQIPLGLSVLRPPERCRTRCQHSRPVMVYCFGARLDSRPAGLLAAMVSFFAMLGSRSASYILTEDIIIILSP